MQRQLVLLHFREATLWTALKSVSHRRQISSFQMCSVNINRPPKCLLILSCPSNQFWKGIQLLEEKGGWFVHINFRHKAQLHIKTLITHLVVEKNVLTIENPQGCICFCKPTSEANSRPRTPLTQPFFLHRAECCGKNKGFLVEPYLAAPRSAHTRSSGHGIQMYRSGAEQCVENTRLPPALQWSSNIGSHLHTQFQAWGWRSGVQKPLRWYLTVAGFLRPPSTIPSDVLEIEQSLAKVSSQWSTQSKVYCSANWNVLGCQQQGEDMFWGPKGMNRQRACFCLLESHHLVHLTWAVPGICTAAFIKTVLATSSDSMGLKPWP